MAETPPSLGTPAGNSPRGTGDVLFPAQIFRNPSSGFMVREHPKLGSGTGLSQKGKKTHVIIEQRVDRVSPPLHEPELNQQKSISVARDWTVGSLVLF